MKSYLVTRIALLIAVITFAVIAMDSYAASGVIISSQGEASVSSGGSNTSARVGLRLQDGDVVKVSGGTVKLLLSNGKTESIDAGSSYTVADGKGDAGKGVSARVVAALGEVMRKDAAPTVAGMVRSASTEIEPLFPRNTFVLADDLKFQWKVADGVGSVDLVIKAVKPVYQQVINVKAGVTSASLRDDAAKPVAGVKCFWKVIDTESSGLPPAESSLCWFGLLSADDSKAVEEGLVEIGKMAGVEESSRIIMKAGFLLSYQLNARALSTLDAGEKQFPTDSVIKEMAARIRLQMNRPANPKE